MTKENTKDGAKLFIEPNTKPCTEPRKNLAYTDEKCR